MTSKLNQEHDESTDIALIRLKSGNPRVIHSGNATESGHSMSDRYVGFPSWVKAANAKK